MIFNVALAAIIVAGVYRVGAVIVAARSSVTHLASIDSTTDEVSLRCGRQGGFSFASWPFGSVTVSGRSLTLGAPALFDPGISEPELDLSEPTEMAVRRFVYFTFVTFRTTPNRYDQKRRRRTIWLTPGDSRNLLDRMGAHPIATGQGLHSRGSA